MSTKIYDAYEYNGKLSNLIRDIQLVRKEYEGNIHTIIKDFVLREKTNGDVNNFWNNSELDGEALEKFIIKENQKKFPTIMDELTFNGSFVVYAPIGKNRIFFQSFGVDNYEMSNKNVFYKKWIKSKRVKDFHYQDQSDPWFAFEKLNKHQLKEAKKDWKDRERIWDKIFKDHSSPISAGLTYELTSIQSLRLIVWAIYREIIEK